MRLYAIVSGTIFALLAVSHGARLVHGWPARIGGFDVPVRGSWFGVWVAGALAVWAFRVARNSRSTSV